jgi:hypothetical protein
VCMHEDHRGGEATVKLVGNTRAPAGCVHTGSDE